jgi:hypothetical protein
MTVNASIAIAITRLAETVAQYIGVPVDDLFIADHTHEGLRPGAYSIAYEGGPDNWPYEFTEAAHAGIVVAPANWHLEAGSTWYLAAYPVRA